MRKEGDDQEGERTVERQDAGGGDTRKRRARASGSSPILVEGSTCARIANAERVAVLTDAEAYFRALGAAFRHAQRRIVIVGWDFDARMRLDPDEPVSELRRLLPALVAARSLLHVHVLVWDVAPLFGPSSAIGSVWDRDWHDHARIDLRFDGDHPSGASQHEKMVCIDDTIAFVGGIDLTVCRWDTCRHTPEDPRRVSPEGEPYPPVHDVQMAVAGDAARAIADVAYERWADAGGERLEPAPPRPIGEVWPDGVRPLLEDTPVGIARTRPRLPHRSAIDEVARLNDAALAAARRMVYIETQYLTARSVADRLVSLLERGREAPEIVMLVWEDASGWIERFAMGANRDRTLRRLAAADRGGRLRVYKLTAPEDPQTEVSVHAKIVIVDDRFLRVGSSNLNNRSLGLDAECDLAIEANPSDLRTQSAIADVRSRLLGEHLLQSPDAVRDAVVKHGLIGAVTQLNPHSGRLVAYRLGDDDGPTEPIAGTALLDPAEPLDLHWLRRRIPWE